MMPLVYWIRKASIDRTIRTINELTSAGLDGVRREFRTQTLTEGIYYEWWKRMIRYTIALGLLVFVGCGITIKTNDISTTNPSKEQVANCRDVMYINPDIDIGPLGYAIETGMDDIIRFKFVAMTDDPSSLFDSAQVDATRFTDNFDPYTLNPQGSEAWWDLSSNTLSGAKFSVPPPNSKGSRGLNIAYVKNDDHTITVYVLWHET